MKYGTGLETSGQAARRKLSNELAGLPLWTDLPRAIVVSRDIDLVQLSRAVIVELRLMASQEYTVAGVRVIFPHRAYGSQIAYMGKVLTALKTAYSTGHGNALLESPTGSGKTLALLCATLAWQQHCNEKCTTDFSAHSPSEAAAASIDTRENHLLTGGGFIPDPGTPGLSYSTVAAPNNSMKVIACLLAIFVVQVVRMRMKQVLLFLCFHL